MLLASQDCLSSVYMVCTIYKATCQAALFTLFNERYRTGRVHSCRAPPVLVELLLQYCNLSSISHRLHGLLDPYSTVGGVKWMSTLTQHWHQVTASLSPDWLQLNHHNPPEVYWVYWWIFNYFFLDRFCEQTIGQNAIQGILLLCVYGHYWNSSIFMYFDI